MLLFQLQSNICERVTLLTIDPCPLRYFCLTCCSLTTTDLTSVGKFTLQQQTSWAIVRFGYLCNHANYIILHYVAIHVRKIWNRDRIQWFQVFLERGTKQRKAKTVKTKIAMEFFAERWNTSATLFPGLWKFGSVGPSGLSCTAERCNLQLHGERDRDRGEKDRDRGGRDQDMASK